MLKRRFLAGLSLAGLIPFPATAQEDDRCYSSTQNGHIRAWGNYSAEIDAGRPALEGSASEGRRSDFPSTGASLEWIAKIGTARGEMGFAWALNATDGSTLASIEFKKDGVLILRRSRVDVARPADVDGRTYPYSLDLGDARRTDPGLIRLARLIPSGELIEVMVTLSNGNGMRATVGFPDLAARLGRAHQLVDQLESRYRAGRCTLPQAGGAGCYLTTATVDAVGLADDCWELRTLRRFRDGPLQKSDQGRALIEDYYRFAPGLVECIASRVDARRQWLITYFSGVLPSAVAASLGLNAPALWLYGRMTHRLRALAA